MGYAGKVKEKLYAQELRKKGYSYKEILTQISVSKDTISRWCKNIELTSEQKKRLQNNKLFGQRKGSQVAAENKRKKRLGDIIHFHQKALVDIGVLNEREEFLIGIALYVAEGDKTDRRVGFANSDVKLIIFMMNWFRKYCNVSEKKFRGAIWLHENKDQIKAKEHWSKLTGIPGEQFYKTYIAENKKDSKKIRKKVHMFGIFAIRFSDAAIHRRIMGWISALFDAKMGGIPR